MHSSLLLTTMENKQQVDPCVNKFIATIITNYSPSVLSLLLPFYFETKVPRFTDNRLVNLLLHLRCSDTLRIKSTSRKKTCTDTKCSNNKKNFKMSVMNYFWSLATSHLIAWPGTKIFDKMAKHLHLLGRSNKITRLKCLLTVRLCTLQGRL